MSLFRRDYRVQIDALELTGIDIKFKVERTLKPQPNKAQIDIYNLTASHRAELAKHRKANATTQPPVHVQLEAGYIGQRSSIFNGDLRYADTKRDGADFVTSLEGADGGYQYKTARVNKSFAAGTSVETVARALAAAMGVGDGNVGDLAKGAALGAMGKTFPEGYVASGSAAVELNALMNGIGCECSIQNGVLQVKPRGKPMPGTAVKLSAETGLIGSPAPVVVTQEPGKKKADAKALQVRALMIGGLYPGRKIVLDSEDFQGGYEITDAVYQGDTAGNDWFVDMQVRPY